MSEPAQRWARSPLLTASVALHVVGAGVVAVSPATWPLVLSGLAADHLLLLGGSLWPRSRLLGPNLTRLPEHWASGTGVGLTFDDGPDPEATPAVLGHLAAAGVRATFFCIGRRAERHPDLVRAIVDGGHRVENHSFRHSNAFCLLGPRALARELDRAQETLARHAGVRPRYFRAPAGLRNPWLEPVLARRGLRLVSWSRRAFDTVTGDADRILDRLTRNLGPGDVILLHDGGSARDASGAPVVLEVLPRLLRHLRERGLRPMRLPPSRTVS